MRKNNRHPRESGTNLQTSSHNVDIWYEGELNIGYGTGGTLKADGESEDAKYTRPFIETVHGVRITPYAFAGLGIGFQYAYDKTGRSA